MTSIFDETWLRTVFKSHPELLAFLSENVECTYDYHQTTSTDTWAQSIYTVAQQMLHELDLSKFQKPLQTLLSTIPKNFPVRCIELERTLFCLKTAEAVSNNDYSFFEHIPTLFGQSISVEQFETLHNLVTEHFPPDQLHLLFTELMIGDLGKIGPLRTHLGKIFKIDTHDHDLFMDALLNQSYENISRILPTIGAISEDSFRALREMNTAFHYGHFAHTESTERELQKLKDVILKRGLGCLYRNILVQIFDVAGAAAHNSGKILLNHDICATYLEDMLPLLIQLETQSPEWVYHQYLMKRVSATQLCLTTSQQILAGQERLTARLLCMLRIYQPAEAKCLQIAITTLWSHPEFIKQIELFEQYTQSEHLQTPTYIPTFLNALKKCQRINEFALQEEPPLATSVRVGLPLVCDILRYHQTLVEQKRLSAASPINFNELAGFVDTAFDEIKGLISHPECVVFDPLGKVFPLNWIRTHRPHEIDQMVKPQFPSHVYPKLMMFSPLEEAKQQPMDNNEQIAGRLSHQ